MEAENDIIFFWSVVHIFGPYFTNRGPVFYKMGFCIILIGDPYFSIFFSRLAIPSGQAAIGAGCAICVVRSSCQHVALVGWLVKLVGQPGRLTRLVGLLAGLVVGRLVGWGSIRN